MGWSVVCGGVVFWSYSLTICQRATLILVEVTCIEKTLFAGF